MTNARRISSRRRPRNIAPWLFISPWIFGFLFFTLGPMALSLFMSLHDWPVVGTRRFIGLQNYQVMLMQDPKFWHTLGVGKLRPLNILLFSCRPSERKGRGTRCSAPRSALDHLGRGPGDDLKWIYSRTMALNYLSCWASMARLAGRSELVDCSVIIAMPRSWAAPLILLGLQSIPKELYEAARVSGDSVTKRSTSPFRCCPDAAFTFITSLISAFQQPPSPFADQNRRSTPPIFAMYSTTPSSHDMGYAAAMSWVMF